MCAKASAKRKDVKAAEDEKAEIKRRSRQDEVKAQMKESATRYLKAAEAAGLSDDVKIKFGYYEHSCPSVALIREYAAGDFGDRFFYKNDLDTNEIINMRETAKQLQCSADYLCGLTDELNPVSNLDTKPEWKEGTPSRIGRYFVKCVFDDDDDPVRMEVQWDGEEWTFRDNLDSFLCDAGLTVLCWWPLPDD